MPQRTRAECSTVLARWLLLTEVSWHETPHRMQIQMCGRTWRPSSARQCPRYGLHDTNGRMAVCMYYPLTWQHTTPPHVPIPQHSAPSHTTPGYHACLRIHAHQSPPGMDDYEHAQSLRQYMQARGYMRTSLVGGPPPHKHAGSLHMAPMAPEPLQLGPWEVPGPHWAPDHAAVVTTQQQQPEPA
jgi:hypothetical protein